MQYIIQLINRENIALLTLVMGILLIFCFIRRLKSDIGKYIGVIIIVSLSLIANSNEIYFLTIIIVATLVTNLEFLLNISAIFRNSNAYFDYATKKLSQEDVEKNIEEEQVEIELEIEKELVDRNETKIYKDVVRDDMSSLEFGLLIEEYTFRYLEKRYNTSIKRHVKIDGSETFDGVLRTSMSSRSLLEIKSSRTGYLPQGYIINQIERKIQIIKNSNSVYRGGDVSLKFILVGNFPQSYKSRLNRRIKELEVKEFSYIDIEYLSFEDIGVENLITPQ